MSEEFNRSVEYEEFFERQQRALVRFCFLATLDRNVAADTAQEALARAWEHWPRIVDGNPEAWVRTVALNIARSRWKRFRRELSGTPAEITATFDTPHDVDLLRALRALPLRQREAVVLHYFVDLTIQECASEMAVSPGAVKQHLSRGRAALERSLNRTAEALP